MQVYDNHIHFDEGKCDSPDAFLEKTAAANVVGGTIISLYPASFRKYQDSKSNDYRQRIDQVLEYTSKTPGFNPFFWVDPKEENAIDQIVEAKKCGIKGIKVICNNFYAGDYIDLWQKVADENLPLLFHSGILWDEEPSSLYNRPLAFESLMKVKGLRFALAHISWPWCDECVALYGKFKHVSSYTGNETFRMYVDTTPGTPPVYRYEALRKLYCSNYPVKHGTIFGTDCSVNSYDTKWANAWLEQDSRIMQKIVDNYADCLLPNAYGAHNRDGLEDNVEGLLRAMFAENYLAFINGSVKV
ncbi:MAG: hypothetical protein IKB16_01010 [Lentisphaeria bacterium]|nr:hypothetical protein [Lentisphaeria bacterium]